MRPFDRRWRNLHFRRLKTNLDVHEVHDVIAIVFEHRDTCVARLHDVRDGVKVENYILIEHVNCKRRRVDKAVSIRQSR